jgi:hypothetical protein
MSLTGVVHKTSLIFLGKKKPATTDYRLLRAFTLRVFTCYCERLPFLLQLQPTTPTINRVLAGRHANEKVDLRLRLIVKVII